MPLTVESAFVRIFTTDDNDYVAGAGFLVADHHILTCVHVVNYSLKERKDNAEQPTGKIPLDFPLLTANPTATAHVVHWDPASDVAGLELDEAPPPDAKPAPWIAVDDIWGHTFKAFGFPEDYRDGLWAEGEIIGAQARGLALVKGVVEKTGFRIQPGFSGGPVWDADSHGIVGMVKQADADPGTGAASFIRVSTLSRSWPLLRSNLENSSIELQASTVAIPFVVMAMTSDEASELKKNQAFSRPLVIDGRRVHIDPDDQERFKEFCRELERQQKTLAGQSASQQSVETGSQAPQRLRFLERYGDTREDWRPYGDFPVPTNEDTIGTIIGKLAALEGFEADFRSELIFGDEPELRKDASYHLQIDGCVLIIDAVSIFHPRLRKLLNRSKLITADDHTAIFVLSPFDFSGSRLNRLVTEEIDSLHYEVFRRIEDLDLLCEFGLGGWRNLMRWLKTALPKAHDIVNRQRAHHSKLDRMETIARKPNTGIGQKFFLGK